MPTRLRRTRTEREAVPRPGILKRQAERFRQLWYTHRSPVFCGASLPPSTAFALILAAN